VLTGLVRAQDVARFTAEDVKAAGKRRGPRSKRAPLLRPLLEALGALAAAPRRLLRPSVVFFIWPSGVTALLISLAEDKALQALQQPAKGPLQAALDALPQVKAEEPPAPAPPPPARGAPVESKPPPAARDALAAAQEAAARLNAQHAAAVQQAAQQAAAQQAAAQAAAALAAPAETAGEVEMDVDP
jgi:type IV secretory pathway VirB10-like protein